MFEEQDKLCIINNNDDCNVVDHQIRVRAYDDGTPAKEAITTVKVTVNRNLRCPQWRSGDKTIEIYENLDIGEEVTSVQATDNDDQVIIIQTFTQNHNKMHPQILCVSMQVQSIPRRTHAPPLTGVRCFTVVFG